MKAIFHALTVVTSCTGYGQYLSDWAESIVKQSMFPGRVVILTHGTAADAMLGAAAALRLKLAGVNADWVHEDDKLDFGVARNCAVSHAETEWVMHFDCDDTLYPYAIQEFFDLAPDADVISAGYTLAGKVSGAVARRQRLYKDATGKDAFNLSSISSGVSPFRKSFWERSPYRTDMVGAWDTALWIGFAHLGARFRATRRAVFMYRQHSDSIFNQRRRSNGWTRARTTAQLRAVRREYTGTAVILPRDTQRTTDREPLFQRVRAHYAMHHAEWDTVVGTCSSAAWIKGAAVNDALERTNADVLVIADADCMVDPDALRESVSRVRSGAPWSMPHQLVYRADRQFTARICAQSADMLPEIPFEDSRDRDPYDGALGGGIVVIRRVWYDAIGGFPLSFQGWGSEDRAFGTIANTLLGKCVRGTADLLHLWHTPQEQSNHNLHILRSIGAAALKGKDVLAVTLSTLATKASLATPRTRMVVSNRLIPQQTTVKSIPPFTDKIRRRIP